MRKMIAIIIISLLGAMLNIGICAFSKGIGFPLYLDTILTIAVTLTNGLIAGILCGAFTNLIIHSIWFYGWEVYLFSLCSAATAVVTWLLMRFFPQELNMTSAKKTTPASRSNTQLSGIMDRIIALILLSFALCVTISVLGGIISAFIAVINQPLTEEAGLAGILAKTMFGKDTPLIFKEILSRIPINSIDRLISAFAGFGIAVCISGLSIRLSFNFRKTGIVKAGGK